MLVFASAGPDVVASATGIPINDFAKIAARGLIVMVMIYTLGGISGAHINPTVSFTFAVRRAFPWPRLPWYWLAQIGGAFGAALALRALFGSSVSRAVNHLGPGVSPAVGFTIEVILGFLLLSVILGVAEEASLVGPNAAIAVGATIALAGIIGDEVSGASMNPARSFAPALVAGNLQELWIYLVAPFVGGIGAAAVTWFFHGPPNRAERKAGSGQSK